MRNLMSGAADGFALGEVHDARPVLGGLSNDLWRVDTARGRFAVKVMRANADAPDFRENLEAAFAVESDAHDRGVPSPQPWPAPDGRALLRVEGHWVRVHRWVDGAPPPLGEHLEDAGRLLAAVHCVGECRNELLQDEPWDGEGWLGLARTPGLSHAIGSRLEDAAPALAALEATTAATPGTVVSHVASHGDLDPKNTLVVKGALIALDWDAAGVRPLAREAVSLALDWSVDVTGFRRVVTSYVEASGSHVPAEPWVFGGWVSALAGWLVFNATTRTRDDAGAVEVGATLDRLLVLHRDLDRYAGELRYVPPADATSPR